MILIFLVFFLKRNLVIKIQTMQGIPIQINSLRITFKPHSLKKFSTPMGETFIGRQGKKYLELSKGERKQHLFRQ